MASDAYLKLLRDPRWQRKRLEIMQRDDFKCTSCKDSESTLNVHHKRYKPRARPWEYDGDDLTTLCETCHKQVTEATESIKRATSLLSAEHLSAFAGYAVGEAFRSRFGKKLGKWEFIDYRMCQGFAFATGLKADDVVLLIKDGFIDLDALGDQIDRDDEESLRIYRASLEQGPDGE